MNIGFFTNYYLPCINGVVRSVSAFRQTLSCLGHNVFVFTHEAESYKDTEPFVFRYPAINLSWPVETPVVMPVSPCIDKVIPILGLQVIHAHHPVLMGQVAADYAEKLALPLVFSFHTRYRDYSHYLPLPIEAVQEMIRSSIDHLVVNFLKRCHHIVVPTPGMRDILINEYGVQNQMTVIPTGIDLTPYQETEGASLRVERGWDDDFVVVSAGRLAVEKNFKTLLSAFAQAAQQKSNMRLVVLGDGPTHETLAEQAQELGISDRTSFEGEVPFEAVPIYLKAANLFAYASTTETQGLVTLEAMAAGLPVAAVEATGTCDLVSNGSEGLLTSNDSAALAQAILRIAQDELLCARFRRAAELKAARYEINRTAERLLVVYEQAIEDRRRGKKVQVETR